MLDVLNQTFNPVAPEVSFYHFILANVLVTVIYPQLKALTVYEKLIINMQEFVILYVLPEPLLITFLTASQCFTFFHYDSCNYKHHYFT